MQTWTERHSSEILHKSFLNKYNNKNVTWGLGDLSYIVYKRTYARTNDDGTIEEWPDRTAIASPFHESVLT